MAKVAFRKTHTISLKWLNQQNCLVKEFSLQSTVNSLSNQYSKSTAKLEPESFRNSEAKEHLLLKKKLLEGKEGTQTQHIFKQLYPWRTKIELAEHLKKNEVYNQDGLIALCKPYGIARSKTDERMKKSKRNVIHTLNSGGTLAHTPSLEETLPILQDIYGTKDLEIVKSSERWASGLILLSSTKKMSDKIEKCFRRSKAFMHPPLTFWAVTNGSPIPEKINTKVAIGLDNVADVGKVPVIQGKYTSAAVKRGELKLAVVKHSTLCHNSGNGASLVEVTIQTLKWHFLRVWLAHCCSPVLGDPLYSGRVKNLFGRKIQVSPHNLTAHHPQDICIKIYQQLGLPEKAVDMIPSLIHLSKIRLSQFNEDKTDLVLTAPPPHHYSWACQKMELITASELKLLLE